jgi:hypothetical protein
VADVSGSLLEQLTKPTSTIAPSFAVGFLCRSGEHSHLRAAFLCCAAIDSRIASFASERRFSIQYAQSRKMQLLWLLQSRHADLRSPEDRELCMRSIK